MPSLNELREFKTSFHHIGGQKANLAAQNVPFDDLKLPNSEPTSSVSLADAIKANLAEAAAAAAAAASAAATAAAAAAATAPDAGDAAAPVSAAPETAEPESAEPELGIDPAGEIDFSAFLGADLPTDDVNPPDDLISNVPEEPPAADSGAPPLDLDSLDNFDMPEELLAADGGDDSLPNLDNFDDFNPPADDSGAPPLDLDSLDNFDMPEELAAADGGNEAPIDFDSFDDFNPPEEPPADDGGDEAPIDLDSFDDFNPPEELLAADGGDEASPNLDNFDDFNPPKELLADNGGDEAPIDLDSFDDFNPPEEPPAADSDEAPINLDSFDDFNPPEEPPAADSDEAPLNLDSFDDFNPPEEPPAADSDEAPLNLDSFDDFNPPEEPPAADSDEAPINLDSFDDFNLPEEPAAADGDENFDLDNLDMPDEPTAADDDSLDLEDLGSLDAPGGAGIADEEESLDLDNLGDLDIPGEPAAEEESENLDLDNLGGFDLGDESAPADGGNLDLENLGDFDLPGEPAAEEGSENLDLDNLGGFDLGDESAPADGGNLDLENLGDLDLPGEPAADESGSPDAFDEMAPSDNYENIELDNLDDADFSDKPAGKHAIDDFSFDELDDVLQKTQKKKKEAFAAAPPPEAKGKQGGKKGKREHKKTKLETAIEDISEVQISDDELEGLLETLSRYPINLRIACEEIISGEIGSTKQIAELIEHLVWGATARETAALASRILDRIIIVPKAFEKSTGAELEAEQASLAYIFVHRFLPVLRVCVFVGLVAASIAYLLFRFVYTPLKAESIYQIGYERIFAGEYERANERFNEAFAIHRKKDWFYKYAEAFRDERQYIYAEQKYDDLLRYYPRDKKGVLDYANLETYYLRNYAKADNILRWNLLDYNPNDREGLLAAGDNCLVWGDVDPAKYEDARYYYARVLTQYGWQPPVVERMMKYFIRTDNLREVLPLRDWFDNNTRYELSAETLGELGGYLLDKQLEEVRGVPNEHIGQIGSVRDLLLKAVYADPALPEPHYHLARYYQHLGSAHEELVSLRVANGAFDKAPEGSVRRLNYHIDARQRYADALINNREFFPAEEQLVKGINLYEDAVSRRLISRSPKYGRLYAVMGDLEYFTKDGDMDAALRFYHRSEQDGWAPPEMQYRMGAAYYQLEDWRNALEYLFAASKDLPLNRRVLFALGNTALKRGDYFAANGYYDRLLDILENQRSRLPLLLPNDQPEFLELAERLLMAQNNAGVASEMLAAQTGNRSYQTRALAFYAEANRAWDARTRDPRSMIRSGNTPLPFLNSRNALYPQQGYEPQIFIRIDREAMESSHWEELVSLPRPDPVRND